jgi:hypothetical protein
LPKKTTRSRPSSGCRSAALVLALAFAAACRIAPPEEVLLRQFFEESRLRDRTALASIATVVFEPTRDGVVQDFRMSNIEMAGSMKRVAIDAQVRSFDGVTTARRLVATLELFEGRWRITNIR